MHKKFHFQTYNFILSLVLIAINGYSQKVGIGTNMPSALLHTIGTNTGGGNVLFVGNFKDTNPGTAPAKDAGTRMMWYPDKAAFRAGLVQSAQWNTENIGNGSIAMGNSTIASGDFSIALGIFTRATALSATSLGDGSIASGFASTAMGNGSRAEGINSTAMGKQTFATGENATSMGFQSTASGLVSTAMGIGTWAKNNYSTSMGWLTQAEGISSTAMGFKTIAGSYASTAIGSYNVGGGNPTDFILTDPIFEIGNGTSVNNFSNAFTVLKNGKVGTGGMATPKAALHVLHPNVSAEGIRIQNTGSNNRHWTLHANNGGGTLILYSSIGGITPVGNFNGSTGAYTATSNRHLKTNISLLGADILTKIVLLEPARYSYLRDPSQQMTIGLMAEDVQPIFPELVETVGENGENMAINYAGFSIVAIKAIQELTKEIEALKKELKELKEKQK